MNKQVRKILCPCSSDGTLWNVMSLACTMFEDANLVNLDYRFKISPAWSPSSCQISASLDDDPSMHPYDPKTNYLSPRPQFLYYRPNSRIERYFHEEEDEKRVEGSFLFESFSDTEVTENTQSDCSHKSDEVSSDGKDKQEQEEEADHNKYEPCLIDNNNSDGNSVGRGNSQPSFRNIYNITALILLLCFGCSSVFHSTGLVNRVLYEESSFLMKNTNPYEIYQFAKSKYPVLAENLQVWSNNAAPFAHGLISNFEEENHQLSPASYFNLSALQEDISVDGYFVFYRTHERMNDFRSKSELLEERPEVEEAEQGSLSQEIPEVEETEQGSPEFDSKGNDVTSASSVIFEMEDQSNVMPNKQVILLFILPPLMAAAIFAHSRRVKLRRHSLSSSEDKWTHIPLSRNWLAEGSGDMAGESCPSELSSFRKNSSYVKTGRRGGSNRKNHRREPLSSSISTDSTSYRSFTAYEIISTKHGDLEEEIVTSGERDIVTTRERDKSKRCRRRPGWLKDFILM